jgi:carboxypeptidase C (cathepsin A)
MIRSLALLVLSALPAVAQPPAQRPRPTDAPASGAAPVVAEMDETLSTTAHSITVKGQKIDYTATVGQMPIKTANGETEAWIFHTAYTKAGVNSTMRPLTFCFNGGPGSASVWVHMGCMGPKRVLLKDNGDMPVPPYKLVDNEETWLDQTDLVFIDPVGTGFSRAKTADAAKRMNGIQGDLQSVGEFIRMYLTRNKRWTSPLFIAGESYGTFRAAGLAGNLVDQGIAVNGVMLISTVLDFATLRPGLASGLPHALFLPTFTADAFYHKKLAPDLLKDFAATKKEAEVFAMGEYLDALHQGDRLPAEKRKQVIEKTAKYTGIDPRYLDHAELKLSVPAFTRELLRDQRLTIGRLDGRLTGPSPRNMGETAEFDPSGTLTRPPFQATFQDYVRGDLGYKTDLVYHVSGGVLPWDYGNTNSPADTSGNLRNAFAKNPHLKVLVLQGYYDLATPYFAAEYTMNHLGVSPASLANVSFAYYHAGHMMYIDRESHKKLRQDVAGFYKKAMP